MIRFLVIIIVVVVVVIIERFEVLLGHDRAPGRNRAALLEPRDSEAQRFVVVLVMGVPRADPRAQARDTAGEAAVGGPKKSSCRRTAVPWPEPHQSINFGHDPMDSQSPPRPRLGSL